MFGKALRLLAQGFPLYPLCPHFVPASQYPYPPASSAAATPTPLAMCFLALCSALHAGMTSCRHWAPIP